MRGPELLHGTFTVICEHCTVSLAIDAIDEDEATAKAVDMGWQAWRRQPRPTSVPFVTFNCWAHHEKETDA